MRDPLGGTTTDAHMSGPDLQQLREYYDRLSDEAIAELHASGPDAYSADAWAILDEEFRRRDIGAERVKAAVSDIKNLEHTEYQRQPQGNDEQPGSLDQPVENNRQKQIHGAVMPIIVSEGR